MTKIDYAPQVPAGQFPGRVPVSGLACCDFAARPHMFGQGDWRPTRFLSVAGSRRRAAGAALIGLLGFLGLGTPEAMGKKSCPPCKKRTKGKCGKTLPDGARVFGALRDRIAA
jgi:hypothetical protein